jgi:type II secretory pathway predicted ATPase ExeA
LGLQCTHTDINRRRAARGAAASDQRISRGYPRMINNLALHALLAAFADGKAIVDESSARAAVAELTTTD